MSNLSNEQYINGLRIADPTVLASIYVEFRTPVIRAITSLGGSEADGGIFFRAGLVEAARQVRAGEFTDSEPFFFQVRELAIAHYRDWLAERAPAGAMPDNESESPDDKTASLETEADNPPSPEATADERAETDQTSNFKLQTPNSDTLRQTRRSIYAWRHFERLDANWQEQVLLAVAPQQQYDAPPLDGSADSVPTNDRDELPMKNRDEFCYQHYLSLLQLAPAENATLPYWVISALHNTEGYHFWQKTQDLERKIANRQPLAPPTPTPPNKWFPRLLLALSAIMLLSWGYNYFFRSATPREVYKENFQPPASILEDLRSRQHTDTMSVGPLPERPVACEEMLQQADANYREKDYAAAAEVLYRIADDQSLAACHSDAWFYLGIIGLHLDDPGTTLQSFAKIDNLDRFGEDIYWYQALAFVKLAEQQPDLRDKAVRAVERALGATQSSERRAQAEEMLKQLGGGLQPAE